MPTSNLENLPLESLKIIAYNLGKEIHQRSQLLNQVEAVINAKTPESEKIIAFSIPNGQQPTTPPGVDLLPTSEPAPTVEGWDSETKATI